MCNNSLFDGGLRRKFTGAKQITEDTDSLPSFIEDVFLIIVVRYVNHAIFRKLFLVKLGREW